MRIIPAIDIIDGKCVRLTKGDFTRRKIYRENPVELALEFEAHGMQYLHLVDLDGARSNHIVNYKILESISKCTSMTIDFGGGIKSEQDIRMAFECGASQVTGGSIALKNPDLFLSWLNYYGSKKIILGADAMGRMIASNGWMETSDKDVLSYIEWYQQKGIQYVICTDIEKDGLLQGVAENLYKEIMEKTSVKLIASGGVASEEDLLKLRDIGCEGVVVGKAIYEGKLTLNEISKLC